MKWVITILFALLGIVVVAAGLSAINTVTDGALTPFPQDVANATLVAVLLCGLSLYVIGDKT